MVALFSRAVKSRGRAFQARQISRQDAAPTNAAPTNAARVSHLCSLLALTFLVLSVANAEISDQPDVSFKLATFEDGGVERVGLLIGGRLLELRQANALLQKNAGVAALELPNNMKSLIEQSKTTRPRLNQIANYFGSHSEDSGFGHDPKTVTIRAPIMYPWNLLAAGQNYRAHAAEMGGSTDIDPDKDNPFLFAKSPRSSIPVSPMSFHRVMSESIGRASLQLSLASKPGTSRSIMRWITCSDLQSFMTLAIVRRNLRLTAVMPATGLQGRAWIMQPRWGHTSYRRNSCRITLTCKSRRALTAKLCRTQTHRT